MQLEAQHPTGISLLFSRLALPYARSPRVPPAYAFLLTLGFTHDMLGRQLPQQWKLVSAINALYATTPKPIPLEALATMYGRKRAGTIVSWLVASKWWICGAKGVAS